MTYGICPTKREISLAGIELTGLKFISKSGFKKYSVYTKETSTEIKCSYSKCQKNGDKMDLNKWIL